MSSSTEQQQTNSNEQTVAATLMQSGGYTIALTGTLFSVSSSVYFLKYLTTIACSSLEFLPVLLSGSQTSFTSFLSGKEVGNLWAYATLGSFMIVGIGLKSFGTYISNPSRVKYVESFLYKKKN